MIKSPDEIERALLASGDGWWVLVFCVSTPILITLMWGVMWSVVTWPHVGGVLLGMVFTIFLLRGIQLKFYIGRMLIRHWFGRPPEED